MDEANFCQFLHDRGNAACFVKVLHMVGTARAHLRDIAGLAADFIKKVKG